MPLIPRGLTKRLFERIKEVVKEQLLPVPAPAPKDAPTPEPEGPVDLGPPSSLEELKYRITFAGRNRLIARMKYNGQWRDTEVYSYRMRDADDPKIPLLYAWCGKDRGIEAFKLKRIEDFQLTDRVYEARWPVEF
jgi:hypothetical protein